jgi:pimeloyl-ACP methyl ester carboxylesterase
MSAMDATNDRAIFIEAHGRQYQLPYFDRHGADETFLYVHGLGCSKADFVVIAGESALDGCRLVSYDQPGCAGTPYDAAHPLNIDRAVEVLEAFVTALGLHRFVLVGGSMGGLISLLFAERHPDKLKAFVNVEGNLTAEDCLFSRHAVNTSFAEFEQVVFPKIKRAVGARRGRGFARHLDVVAKANPRAYYDYSLQLVEYSDEGRLLERFLALSTRTYFVYGAENRHLSYLPRLCQSTCTVLEVPRANHFPFYDNPAAFAAVLSECR